MATVDRARQWKPHLTLCTHTYRYLGNVIFWFSKNWQWFWNEMSEHPSNDEIQAHKSRFASNVQTYATACHYRRVFSHIQTRLFPQPLVTATARLIAVFSSPLHWHSSRDTTRLMWQQLSLSGEAAVPVMPIMTRRKVGWQETLSTFIWRLPGSILESGSKKVSVWKICVLYYVHKGESLCARTNLTVGNY